MRRSRHTDEEIAFLLREAENGTAMTAICASAQVSVGTFYRWRRRFGGLPPAAVKRLGEVEGENARLRAEVAALRYSLLAFAPRDLHRRTPVHPAAPVRPATAPIRYRGSHASMGRYAAVRTTN